MPRPLAECGTFTAYKRHKRNGEPVDDACAQAARDQKNIRADAKREDGAAAVRLILTATPVAPADADGINELEEAYDTLRWIKAQMDAGITQGAAALAKQRIDLVAHIKRLESASKPGVSKLDELAKRRQERLAAASS